MRELENRVPQERDHFDRLRQDKAPAEEVRQAEREWALARYELDHFRAERDKRRREASWPVRLLREVHRRAGW